MKAIKCDRCSVFGEKKYSALSIMKPSKSLRNYADEKQDLCEKCQKSLEDWWNCRT